MNALRQIRRVGIVNRGDAAMRCIHGLRTFPADPAQRLESIVLYTDPDRDAPFVRHADQAVRIGHPGGAVAAYLDRDAVVQTLVSLRCDAVWPGWGFLAEDPAFADLVEGAGMVFLGPRGETMRRLGDKIASKELAESLGIPVAAWSGGVVETAEEACAAARAIGFPVVLKAAAGGGGRGIRVAATEDELAAAFPSAMAEARAAFGDGRLFVEARFDGGRHVEVQIVGDGHGHVLSLGCRDCSVQRRHQKRIEEAPPPHLPATLLRRLERDAVRLARAVDYRGAGTVEFLVAGHRHVFLEVNPRLQVEHGVTELVTGTDLVHLQLRVGRGESLQGLRVRRHGVAIEARVCAEDPEAGFLPAPGWVSSFRILPGPGVRIDAAVDAGSRVPAEFDSLVAKVMAHGANREEALARLVSALCDLHLAIRGGTTNRSYLIGLLQSADFRSGRIDTGWLDRQDRAAPVPWRVEALLCAAILLYQSERRVARNSFFADPARAETTLPPPSLGQEIELTHAAHRYRLQVYAMGQGRYRLHMDGRVVTASLREDGPDSAVLRFGERTHRVVHDIGAVELRVEIDGRAHRFGRGAAGEVRASAPSLVVSVDVAPGERVEPGQPLGVLEAMKLEIAFHAPLAGIVREVRVHRGQQVAAGDVLVVIEPLASPASAAPADSRLQLPVQPDPVDLFFTPRADALAARRVVELRRAALAPAEARRLAIETLQAEVRRVLLGYDTNPRRVEQLVAVLEARVPADVPRAFLQELGELRRELIAFADVEQLFLRTPRSKPGGVAEPSNRARLLAYLRRMRAGGAGIAPHFLARLRTALAHYGVDDLTYGEALERAVFRLLATQTASALRRRLVSALLRHVVALARAGLDLRRDAELASALWSIAELRPLVGHALADLAMEAGYVLFDEPQVAEQLERTTGALERWLAEAENAPGAASAEVLEHLASAPAPIFDRIGAWLADEDPRRRAVALRAWVRRLHAPVAPQAEDDRERGGVPVLRARFPRGRTVAAVAGPAAEPARVLRALEEEIAARGAADTAEVILLADADDDLAEAVSVAAGALPRELPCARVTFTVLRPGAAPFHRTFALRSGRWRRLDLHGLHPRAAERVDLARLARFRLRRIEAAEGIYCFLARARTDPGDERVFVLADVHERLPAAAGAEDGLPLAAFQRAFHEATRTLRLILALRDRRQRLQWNRIALFLAHPVRADEATVLRLVERLEPATHHLGLEKVVVRFPQREAGGGARPVEVVIASPVEGRIEIEWRAPHREPLRPANAYERRVVAARRRGLLYPYEIIRMLESGEGPGEGNIPPGRFEEYDLDPFAPQPRAVSVAGRQPGENRAAVVFGIISTPTAEVPEGMRRVLILSDPTAGMGALAAPECDRIVAAIDLAERERIPVEWIPVSSGARIAMDSGTENLDATARVARRIVTFTQAGGAIHVIVHGVNVGAQSYFNALATMLLHTRGVLVMTARGAMVLTGRAALLASGSVAAEDEIAIGGYERIMGPNGEAQYFARDLAEAYGILYRHYRYTYVPPGEAAPRRVHSSDPADRAFTASPYPRDDGAPFATVGEIFDDRTNPGRKQAFAMRPVMAALADRDAEHLERWSAWAGAETAIVWDTCVGGIPVCLIGIESRNVPRLGYRPADGPETWTGGTLFPQSSRKVARALNAASGNRPAVILANLSGFDGSPESMRKWQLENGAEIARAVVNFRGPILFAVVSRYHGGAYVVFSRELNDDLSPVALQGSYASVIGGGPAAAVVFQREVRARTAADPRVAALQEALRRSPGPRLREELDRLWTEVQSEKQAEVAAEFDAVHTVERALRVGSLSAIIEPGALRRHAVEFLAARYAGSLAPAPPQPRSRQRSR